MSSDYTREIETARTELQIIFEAMLAGFALVLAPEGFFF
jgi:hypothetical protein